jgi:hypothetical protein
MGSARIRHQTDEQEFFPTEKTTPLATLGIQCDSRKCPCWVRFLF